MESLKEIGREIDEILSCVDLTDEQKIKASVFLLNKEVKSPKETISEELFRRAFKKTNFSERNLKKIRGHISLSYAYSPDEFSHFSPIRMYRHISRFIENETPSNFSAKERKKMKDYIKRKFFINF